MTGGQSRVKGYPLRPADALDGRLAQHLTFALAGAAGAKSRQSANLTHSAYREVQSDGRESQAKILGMGL